MAIHKLSIDDFDEVKYELIAIHTSLEDYQLAYSLNQKLPIILAKNKIDIQTKSKNGESWFSRFTYDDANQEIAWDLIQNKSEIIPGGGTFDSNLFESTQDIASHTYLLPEFKKVDYFLKITNGIEQIDDLISKLNTISKISTLYKVDDDQIKSKNNLIF